MMNEQTVLAIILKRGNTLVAIPTAEAFDYYEQAQRDGFAIRNYGAYVETERGCSFSWSTLDFKWNAEAGVERVAFISLGANGNGARVHNPKSDHWKGDR